MNKLESTIPFCGFYESFISDDIDYQIGQQASTSSDWLAAEAGLGLNVYSETPLEHIDEQAVYVEAQGYLNDRLNYTLGMRYDHSDAYGGTTNPRAAINYNASQSLVFKLLYGQAFREPSIFELNDEFRGNPNLKPEQVRTTELVSHYFLKFFSNHSQLVHFFCISFILFIFKLIILAYTFNDITNFILKSFDSINPQSMP